jgi:hypothetical protein
MVYKGVPYNYAFTFKVPNENSTDREFNVVISNFRNDSKDFSGLCLENELRVISEQKMLFAAFYEIVDNIIKLTTESEKEILESHQIKAIPLMKVTDKDFLKNFDEYKKSMKSLEYYERLRIWFETPESSREQITQEPTKPEIFACQSVVNFHYMTQMHQTPIKDVKFFTI